MTAWSPWAEGETAARALAAAGDIARDLTRASGPGLSRGHAGLALFFAYLEKAGGHAEAGELAQYHLDRAVDELAERPAGSGLYFGFTGVAWVTEHLAAEVLTGEDDPNAEVDDALLSLLRQAPWKGVADLLGGLVGLGVYALERLPRPTAAAMVPLIVARLGERAGEDGRGLAGDDPGMAHGAAGVIALLARLIREAGAGPEAASLLASTVDGVLHHLSSRGEEEDDLAWCSGGAGLSAALLAASRASGRDDWERAGSRLAAAMAERRPGDRPFDPALCHGTAGLSHLFYRLHQAAGDPATLAAARYWLERTLAARRPGEGIGGYLCLGRQEDGRRGWIVNPGFLDGAAGTGLALLAAATPVAPEWDRLLLLSDRPARSCQGNC